MARISCPDCHAQFTPRRGTRRKKCYVCSPERNASGPDSQDATPKSGLNPGAMYAAVQAELVTLNAVGSVAGAVALRLALSLDDPALGAAQVSSISNQLLKTLEPLQKLKPRVPDKLDEQTSAVLELVKRSA